MTDTKPSFITLRGFHDAGEGIAFAIAELDPGRFWVLAREASDGPFLRLHDRGIRREGAEAMAAAMAQDVNRENPAGSLFGGCNNLALEYDAAAALLPFLGNGPDAWEQAVRIAQARPWEMPPVPYGDPDDLDAIPF